MLAIVKGNLYLSVNDGACANDEGPVSNTLLALPLDFSRSHKLSSPVWNFGVTGFQFRLTLVGGIDPGTQEVINKLWTSEDGNKWEETLPPMRVGRERPSVTSVGAPEGLVVAGGFIGNAGNATDTVEVLMNGEQWFTVQSLPFLLDPQFIKPMLVHNGTLIIPNKMCYCCGVDELLRSCVSDSAASAGCLWRVFECPNYVEALHSFGQQLIATGSCLHVLDPDTQKWLDIEKCPEGMHSIACSVLLPSGELVYINAYDTGCMKALPENSERNYVFVREKSVRNFMKVSLKYESIAI